MKKTVKHKLQTTNLNRKKRKLINYKTNKQKINNQTHIIR